MQERGPKKWKWTLILKGIGPQNTGRSTLRPGVVKECSSRSQFDIWMKMTLNLSFEVPFGHSHSLKTEYWMPKIAKNDPVFIGSKSLLECTKTHINPCQLLIMHQSCHWSWLQNSYFLKSLQIYQHFWQVMAEQWLQKYLY